MKYYEYIQKLLNKKKREAKPYLHLTKNDVMVSIKAILFFKIQKLMLIYYNNVKTTPDKAFSTDIDTIRKLIAEYYDFINRKNELPNNILLDIYYNYILKDKYDIPHLNKNISDNKFIDLYDYINNSLFTYKSTIRKIQSEYEYLQDEINEAADNDKDIEESASYEDNDKYQKIDILNKFTNSNNFIIPFNNMNAKSR